MKGEKYQNITYFHRLKKWYVSPVDSRFLPPSNFSLHVNIPHVCYIKVRFQLWFVHKLETRPTKENSDAYFNLLSDTTDSLLYKEKNSMSRENSLPKPFFFHSFFFFFFPLTESIWTKNFLVALLLSQWDHSRGK